VVANEKQTICINSSPFSEKKLRF